MLLNGKEGLECEVYVEEIRLEHVSEFIYLGCVLVKLGIDGLECSRKVESGRRVAGVIGSIVNARDLLHESCKKHTLYLFLCMAMRQYYGRRRRNLELGLYRCTTSEDC